MLPPASSNRAASLVRAGLSHLVWSTASDLVDEEGLRQRPSPVLLVLVSDADQDVVSTSCQLLPGRVSTHQREMSLLAFTALLKTCGQSLEVSAHNTTHRAAG